MRTIALAFLIVLFNAPANTQALQINGRFGYLSEYEVSAEVTAIVSDGRKEFLGPMTTRWPLHPHRTKPNGRTNQAAIYRYDVANCGDLIV